MGLNIPDSTLLLGTAVNAKHPTPPSLPHPALPCYPDPAPHTTLPTLP